MKHSRESIMQRYVLRYPRNLEPAGGIVPAGLRSDARVAVVDEMPRMLLIECAAEVAEEWLSRMPGWTLQSERRVRVPDPRPGVA